MLISPLEAGQKGRIPFLLAGFQMANEELKDHTSKENEKQAESISKICWINELGFKVVKKMDARLVTSTNVDLNFPGFC